MKVHLFIPCFVDQLYPETAFNMVKVLERAGCEIIYNSNQTCCGQPAFNAGFWNEAKPVAKKFLKDFDEASYIVSPSASCTGFVRNYYPKLFADTTDLKLKDTFSMRVYEFSEFLINVLEVETLGASFNATATYHDSCAALRECGIKSGPRRLLSNVTGLKLIEMADCETCCGFGGTFSVKFEAISSAMADQKTKHALATGAEYIISTDLSCLMQLQGYINANQLPLKSIHLADVLSSGW